MLAVIYFKRKLIQKIDTLIYEQNLNVNMHMPFRKLGLGYSELLVQRLYILALILHVVYGYMEKELIPSSKTKRKTEIKKKKNGKF